MLQLPITIIFDGSVVCSGNGEISRTPDPIERPFQIAVRGHLTEPCQPDSPRLELPDVAIVRLVDEHADQQRFDIVTKACVIDFV